MYALTVEAQEALQAARAKVVKALNDAARTFASPDECRHLTALNYILMGAEFVADEAVNAGKATRCIPTTPAPAHLWGPREK